MHQWPWFFPEVFKKTGHLSCLCPFTFFALKIFIVQVLGGGGSEQIAFSWPSHPHTVSPSVAAVCLAILFQIKGKQRETLLKVQPLTQNYNGWICRIHERARVGWNWIHTHHKFVPAVSNPRGEDLVMQQSPWGHAGPGVGVGGNCQEFSRTQNGTQTINCIGSLPSKTDEYLGASSAVW